MCMNYFSLLITAKVSGEWVGLIWLSLMRSSVASNTFDIDVGVCERQFRRRTGILYRVGKNFVCAPHGRTHWVDADPCGSWVMFSWRNLRLEHEWKWKKVFFKENLKSTVVVNPTYKSTWFMTLNEFESQNLILDFFRSHLGYCKFLVLFFKILMY